MSPLALFLIIGGILAVFAIFNWRERFQAAKRYQEEQAREAAALRPRLGPNYKTGARKAEPKLAMYEPPSKAVGDGIDLKRPMEEVDAALDELDRLTLENLPIGAS